MTNQVIIEVNEETMNFMEALHFDVNAYVFLMKSILIKDDVTKQEGYEYNESIYRIFMDEYRKLFAEYENTKKEILEAYVPKEHQHLVFNFNFERKVLESTGGSCNECNC